MRPRVLRSLVNCLHLFGWQIFSPFFAKLCRLFQILWNFCVLFETHSSAGPGHDSSIKLRGQKKEAESSFCPFAPVESFLVAKVGIGEGRCWGDIDRVVTWSLLAQGTIRGPKPWVGARLLSFPIGISGWTQNSDPVGTFSRFSIHQRYPEWQENLKLANHW